MPKYTKKEREAINAAYYALHQLTDHIGRNYQLDKAEKLERRERSNIISARALLVDSADCGPRLRAGDLDSYADGCAIAAMIGGRLYADDYRPSDRYSSGKSNRQRFQAWRRKYVGPCREAQHAAITRALDALSPPRAE